MRNVCKDLKKDFAPHSLRQKSSSNIFSQFIYNLKFISEGDRTTVRIRND